MIFETERLIVRGLIVSGLSDCHELQSNPNVMQFAGVMVIDSKFVKLLLNIANK